MDSPQNIGGSLQKKPVAACVWPLINPPIGRMPTMRTNIEIDDELIREVLRVKGLKTKRKAVELGLRTLLRLKQQERIQDFRGKLH